MNGFPPITKADMLPLASKGPSLRGGVGKRSLEGSAEGSSKKSRLYTSILATEIAAKRQVSPQTKQYCKDNDLKALWQQVSVGSSLHILELRFIHERFARVSRDSMFSRGNLTTVSHTFSHS
jgi:hypothetical protein